MLTFAEIPVGTKFRYGAGNFLWIKTAPGFAADVECPNYPIDLSGALFVRLAPPTLVAVPLSSLAPGTKCSLTADGPLDCVVATTDPEGIYIKLWVLQGTRLSNPHTVYVIPVTKPLREFKPGDKVLISGEEHEVIPDVIYTRRGSNLYGHSGDKAVTAIP